MVRTRPTRARGSAVGLALVAALGILAAAAPAHAQDAQGPTFNLQLFRPAVDSKGYFTQNASQILGHLDFSIGLIGTYAHDTLELHGPNVTNFKGEVGGSTFRVTDFVTAQVQGAIGLFKWV